MIRLLNDHEIRAHVEPITVDQYRRMGAAGILDSRTELIRGVILRKMIKSPLHTFTVRRLIEVLLPQLAENVELRKEEPLTLDTSEPEPDIALVIRGSYDPVHCHPTTACLVIEVAVNSEALDRAKASIYAAAHVPEYWLVLPGKQQVERFMLPGVEGYTAQEIYDYDATLETKVGTRIQVDLKCLLPE